MQHLLKFILKQELQRKMYGLFLYKKHLNITEDGNISSQEDMTRKFSDDFQFFK
jgi:hypothetical protein